MKIRAKFTCNSVERNNFGQEIVKLHAVYGSGGENAEWAKATPSGTLQLTIDNPGAQGVIQPGQDFFIDLTPAD